MSEKEDKKPEGLQEVGKIFTFDFDIIEDFVVQSSVKKLQEILKEDIQIAGVFMMLPKSKKIVFLLALPTSEGEEKTMLISTQEEDAERVYEALSSLKKR